MTTSITIVAILLLWRGSVSALDSCTIHPSGIEPLIDGVSYKVPNSSFSADQAQDLFPPKEARLLEGFSWKSNNNLMSSIDKPWLQIVFEYDVTISIIRTAGSDNVAEGSVTLMHVTTFQVQIGNSTGNLQFVESSPSTPMIFERSGNLPSDSLLPFPVSLRVLRIIPNSWTPSNQVILRAEALGCPNMPISDVCATRVGSEPLVSGAHYRIPDGSFSAESSDFGGVGYGPPEARLTGNTWCSAVGRTTNTWLQIAFQSEMMIKSIQTVGYPGITPFWYVTSFQLLIGNDTGNLQAIKQTGSMEPMTFVHRNFNYPEETIFPNFITTRILRFVPITYVARQNLDQVCLRVEVYGCPPIKTICESEITTIPPLEQEGSNITLQWPQANLGEEVTVPCSCGGLTIGSISLVATRRCGGDFTLGARWETPMQVTCNFSPVSQDICQVARLILHNLEQATYQLQTITRDQTVGSVEITLTTVVMEAIIADVTRLQSRNVSNGLLEIVDNLIKVDPSELLISQADSNATARILNVIDVVTAYIPIPNGETGVVVPLSLFAISVQEMSTVNFREHIFSVNFANISLNGNERIDPRLIGYEISSESTDAISIPEAVFDDAPVVIRTRVSNTVYLKDSLFQRRNKTNLTVGGIIISASVINRTIQGLSEPIMINFTKSDKVRNGINTSCNFWDLSEDDGFGDWSDLGCRVINETDEMVICECDHLTNFAILLDVKPVGSGQSATILHTLSSISYIGVIVSILSLIVIILTYLIPKELRNSKNAPLLINLCFSLLGIYVMFIISSLVVSETPVCATSGAVLHYFMLVTFLLMAAEAFDLFLHLVIVIGIPSFLNERYALKAAILSWGLPVPVIILSFAPKWTNYYSAEIFCRPYDLPFYISLITPFVILYSFIWIMFLVIILSLFACKKSFDTAHQTSIAKLKKQLIVPTTLGVLFGIGWGIGLAATQGITNVILLTFMQVVFILLTAFHGLYIFIMYGLRLKDARDAWKSWIVCNGKGKSVSSTSDRTAMVYDTDSKAGSLPRLREEGKKKISGPQVKIAADKGKHNLQGKHGKVSGERKV